MSVDWIQLLAGSVVFGAALVVGMVVRKHTHLAALAVAVIGLVSAVVAFGSLSVGLGTPQVIALAVFFLLAGIVGGYWVSAAALPLLARREIVTTLSEIRVTHEPVPGTAVVLLACADPARYDARTLASRQRLLVESEALTVPATAAPFIFLSEKTRYRAVGGILPSEALAHTVAERLGAALASADDIGPVSVAWCCRPPMLTDVVTRLYGEGLRSIVVAPLGSTSSLPGNRARRMLEDLRAEDAGLRIAFTTSIWESNELADRLAERILKATRNMDPGEAGVALIGEGEPPSWSLTHPRWSEEENYFAQRVRMHLTMSGLDERHIRVGWLDWQLPDVTETVRHLAALGCSRIVIAPGMIPLPSLATQIDLRHAVRMARLSDAVSTVILDTWDDDETLIEVLARSVRATLG